MPKPKHARGKTLDDPTDEDQDNAARAVVHAIGGSSYLPADDPFDPYDGLARGGHQESLLVEVKNRKCTVSGLRDRKFIIDLQKMERLLSLARNNGIDAICVIGSMTDRTLHVMISPHARVVRNPDVDWNDDSGSVIGWLIDGEKAYEIGFGGRRDRGDPFDYERVVRFQSANMIDHNVPGWPDLRNKPIPATPNATLPSDGPSEF